MRNLVVKRHINSKRPLKSARELLLSQFKFLNTLCYECNTPENMPPVCVRIASAVIVLG